MSLLAFVRETFEAADPMPEDLPERIRFAIALRELEAEVARVAPDSESELATRGDRESWTVTFDSESLTIMIRVDENPDGTARVDGWIAPPRAHPVEIRRSDNSMTVTADKLGRFVFGSVPRGMARLVVHPPAVASADGGHDASAAGEVAGGTAGRVAGGKDAPLAGGKAVITPTLTL
ncbi:MAG: hypothetical protein J2P25_13305 [Nocardiopsaceae bacterium]|nr:hypothetical protein [Nocardiopsaceae bacterium]